jgi:hypothetical protein
MKRFKFTCDDDVAEFIQYLVDTDTVFHLDDDPEDIVWQKMMGTGDIAILKLNMIDLWNYGDPWLVMSKYPKIEQAYMGGEE